MIKYTGKLALGLATVVAAVGLVQTPAFATPTGCSAGQLGSNGAWARCTGGTGSYRVWIKCWNDYNKYTTLYGFWQAVNPADYESYKYCTSSYPYRTSYGYQVA